MFLTFGVMAVWPKRKSQETKKTYLGFSVALRRPTRMHRGKKLNRWCYEKLEEAPPSYDDAAPEDSSGFDQLDRSCAPSPTSVGEENCRDDSGKA